MTRSASASHLGPEFNDFLFAPIGEAKNGMPLSVLSALARLDVDPWQEAAELARLPGETAIQRLASLIRTLPDGPSTHPDSKTIAARLIAFLPRGPCSVVPPHEALLAVGAVAQSRALVVYMTIFMVFMLGAQLFLAGRQPPEHVGHPHVSTVDEALPKVPLPKSGQ
jgi:hypothetical protein